MTVTRRTSALLWLALACWGACARPRPAPAPIVTPARPSPFPVGREVVVEPGEGEARHLRDIRQVTLDGAQNADPVPSPDGRWIALVQVATPDAGPAVVVVDPSGRNRRTVSPPGWTASCPAWVPADGGALLFAASPDAGGPLDLFQRGFTGDATRVTALPGDELEPSFNAHGGLLFTSTAGGDGDVYRVPPDGGAPIRLTQQGGPAGSPSSTPDGRFVVYRSFQDGGPGSELFLVASSGGTARQLTRLGVTAWSPSVHPGGRVVVFSADLRPHVRAPGSNFDLYALDLESGAVERITFAEGPDTLPAFSADGRTLYWTSGRQGGANQVFAAQWVD